MNREHNEFEYGFEIKMSEENKKGKKDGPQIIIGGKNSGTTKGTPGKNQTGPGGQGGTIIRR